MASATARSSASPHTSRTIGNAGLLYRCAWSEPQPVHLRQLPRPLALQGLRGIHPLRHHGQEVVNGFKNGFCVLDLECSGGGAAQYGCNNMGISPVAVTSMAAGLDCQWIDVTGIPEGRLHPGGALQLGQQIRTRSGRVETNHVNNWAQVCIEVGAQPRLLGDVNTNCEPYVDCAGRSYGSAQMDCEGVCNGSRLIGDLDMDNDQDYTDAQDYIERHPGQRHQCVELQRCQCRWPRSR